MQQQAEPQQIPLPNRAEAHRAAMLNMGAVAVWHDQMLFITKEPRKGSAVHMDDRCPNGPGRQVQVRLCSVCCKNPE